MPARELHISTINQLYGFGWALEDFLVTDEQFTIHRMCQPLRIDGYVIGICLEGSIELEADSVRYSGTAHSMLIARPLQLLNFVALSPDCRIRFIIFSKRFLASSNIYQAVLQGFQFSHRAALPVIRTSSGESARIVAQFENIWSRFNDLEHPFRKEVVGSLLLVLLYDFEAIYKQHFRAVESRSRPGELTQQFFEHAQRDFRKEHAVEFYARLLHVTPKYLSSVIKETTGRTAGAIISELLLLEAQALLKNTRSIKEVAHALGFPDQSTFGKFFKRAQGSSPSDFIKAQDT
ncbi:MAG: AraC family transcriptional regulator [Sphingobacteriales bacterium]|nr:MAG: AraC family transcriptional regulator [Sphingobacteriales bacterium]